MDVRVSKKAKKESNEIILKELSEKYPDNLYKISTSGNVVKKYKSTWEVVCKHNVLRNRCPDETCGGGKSLCIHKKVRSHCAVESCGGGKSLCRHGLLKSACKDPDCKGGTAYCKHGRQKTRCKELECEGGGSLCVHLLQRSRCKVEECKGGASICVHGIIKTKCRVVECGGGSAFCPCGRRKEYCSTHGGSGLCVKCNIHVKNDDLYCVSCHPDYIPALKTTSKVGCKYLCSLQSYLGPRVSIQHVHYDKITKSVIGTEYRLPEYKQKKVDGFYIDLNGERIVIEFLGDYYHGHHSLWGPDEQNTNWFGKLHKDNFYKTERIFNKMLSFGYVIRYVWECDYRKLKALQSPISILREFKGKLEY